MTDEAFSRAARTYGDTLFRVAYHALQNRADAEDVMQTVPNLCFASSAPVLLPETKRKDTLFRVSFPFCGVIRTRINRLQSQSWKFPLSDNSVGRQHPLLSPHVCLPAKAGGAVNGGAVCAVHLDR